LKIKLKVCHFDTIEVIEAEPQAVLNSLTDPDFQDAFKKWQKRWERCIVQMVASKHQVSSTKTKQTNSMV
jgi:hypothetical protein